MAWAAGLAAGLILLLAVPVDVAFTVEPGARPRARVRWLFGLVPLPAGGGERRRGPREKPERRKKGSRRKGGRRALAALRAEGLVRHTTRLARRLLAGLRVRRLDLDVVVGLDDPADTGRLWALVGPVCAMLHPPARARVRVAPDFNTAVFQLDGRGEVRVVPLAVLAVLVVFLLSPPVLRAMWAVARA